MRVLFDKSAPYGLTRHLEGQIVSTAEKLGWDRLANGALLTAAEEAGFDVLLTADKNLRYQQNLSTRKIALVALGNSPWPLVRLHIPEIVAAVNAATFLNASGTEGDVAIPRAMIDAAAAAPSRASIGLAGSVTSLWGHFSPA